MLLASSALRPHVGKVAVARREGGEYLQYGRLPGSSHRRHAPSDFRSVLVYSQGAAGAEGPNAGFKSRAWDFAPPKREMARNGYPTPGPQSPTASTVMEDVFFLTDLQWQQAASKRYDYIIIGTSFCALSFVAKALEPYGKDYMGADKPKFLLLERGPFFLPSHFQTLPRPFADTLGGKSEVFPWTVDRRTASGDDGTVTSCHGSIPFFGGRSTVWSTWCPQPTAQEMEGWPQELVDVLKVTNREYFDFAQKLLRVQAANLVGEEQPAARAAGEPLFDSLQRIVQQNLASNAADADATHGIDRIEAAPLASADIKVSGVDFLKFSVPGSLLELKKAHPGCIDIKLNCTIEKVLNQQGWATALQTTCGVLPLGDAKLVMAMGALPATTLIQNSFCNLKNVAGRDFSAHFITAVTARVPRSLLLSNNNDPDFHQVGACYIAGRAAGSYKQQFHIQLSIISDDNPSQHAAQLMRYMPDVVASASDEQLKDSKDKVVLVCAVLGELDVGDTATSTPSGFTCNPQDTDATTNSMLRVRVGAKDEETWDAMDAATFEVLENYIFSSATTERQVEYWHADPRDPTGKRGTWKKERPTKKQFRVPALVHESSTLPIGNPSSDERALVDLDYKLKGAENVYVTGAGLWPRGGSWNPTLTMVAMAAHLATKLEDARKKK